MIDDIRLAFATYLETQSQAGWDLISELRCIAVERNATRTARAMHQLRWLAVGVIGNAATWVAGPPVCLRCGKPATYQANDRTEWCDEHRSDR